MADGDRGMVFEEVKARGYSHFVYPPWTIDNGDDVPNEVDEQFSLLLKYRGQLPDGRQIVHVVQHSLVCPDTVSTLFQVVTGGNRWYSPILCTDLDSRTVACIFEDIWMRAGGKIPVVLVEKFTKRRRTLLVARPNIETAARAIWRENGMENWLNVLYYNWDNTDAPQHAERRVHLHYVQYEIAASHAAIDEMSIQPRLRRSMSFPTSSCWACLHLHHKPPAIVLSHRDQADPTDVRVLVLDRSLETWKMVTPDQWMAMLRDNNGSPDVIRAAEAISPLSPRTSRRCLFNTTIPNVLDSLCPSVDSTESVYFAGNDAILQFSSKPPSLKRLATESLCTGNRTFNRAEL